MITPKIEAIPNLVTKPKLIFANLAPGDYFVRLDHSAGTWLEREPHVKISQTSKECNTYNLVTGEYCMTGAYIQVRRIYNIKMTYDIESIV